MIGNTKFMFMVLGTLMGLSACQRVAQEPAKEPLPNIVYILADDLGYGDVTAYNPQGKIATPNIDQLAREGMRFTDAHSGSAVCSPTRYGILTGRYAWRSSLQQGVTWSYDPPLIPESRLTVASFLKSKGYRTGCVGKWHLGLGWSKDSEGHEVLTAPITGGPNQLGFDYFYGISASLDIPPYIYIENNRSTSMQIDTQEAHGGKAFIRKGPRGADFVPEEVLPNLTRKAVGFIEQHGHDSVPFFLYFPMTAPHTPILPGPDFQGQSRTNAYGDFVLMVDNMVGQIRQALEAQGLLDRTLILFTSDNGCSPMADFPELDSLGHHPSYIYRGAKADIYEGGHRIPFIARWPGHIPAGSIARSTTCLTDLLATCAEIVQDSLPSTAGEDSYSLMPLFREDSAAYQRGATVHHSIEGCFAVRQGRWKAVFCGGSGGWSHPTTAEVLADSLPRVQLFDLVKDPSEKNNLALEYTNIVTQLQGLLNQYVSTGRSTPGLKEENDVPVEIYKY
ncbi:MAG TPA: arylsulfatase [Saprospiraceae bacterium]|nr:arylsulfatase [Saprospiraceae bacterium]